jgi:hypothetical protein
MLKFVDYAGAANARGCATQAGLRYSKLNIDVRRCLLFFNRANQTTLVDSFLNGQTNLENHFHDV